MTTLARCCVCSFIIFTYWCSTVFAQVVEIPDLNLEKAIREALELPNGTHIIQQQMLQLTRLEAREKQIENLTGLEYATNLTDLRLAQNEISDLTPLVQLNHLLLLSIWANPISNLSPLANLTRLKSLDLGGCQVSDITPLANLTELTYLTLHSNLRIIDIIPLTNLTQLTELRLSHNRIVDISPLANLTQLTELQLSHNQIVDISPLANLMQLTDLTLANNTITDFSPLFGLNLINIDIDIHKLQELASVDVKITDPNLEHAIREELGLPVEVPITQLVMNQLTRLRASQRQISILTGLEHAVNLKMLSLWGNPISDLSPLANLTQLRGLDLGGCDVSDITPLANLTHLEWLTLHWNHLIVDISPLANLTQLTQLRLTGNRIVDVSPLSNLTMLEELWIANNYIIDFSPIDGLQLKVFRKGEPCVAVDLPIEPRMDNRSFPSVFRAWNPIANLPELSDEDRTARHDLYWHGLPFGAFWLQDDSDYHLMCDIERARSMRDELLARNPNMLFLAEVRYRDAVPDRHYPEDWFGWVRDESGNLVTAWAENKLMLVDFTLPEVQNIIVQKAVAIAKSGLFDGIVFDWWHEDHFSLADWRDNSIRYSTKEAELQARLSIVQRIRDQVRDDFLIIGNTNRRKIPVTAPYLNGGYMETGRDHDFGYTYDGLKEIESSLLWLEENLRSPQVNCLEGWGVGHESPHSPTNKRWMRVFTTMSLTHSDGYVMYNMGGILFGVGDHAHIWHDFWDANLGRPVGIKARRYQNIDGLYIREFANGWAVYNRSGAAQTITLTASATPVSDREGNSASQTHILPDLDGEIYLTTKSFADVNSDGKVNILDLIQVANSLGKSAPDPNGDSVVNILDLVFVAQQFSQ